MTTETEMQRIIGSVLWMSGEVFVGAMTSTSDGTETDHPGLSVKTPDGSEFHIPIIQVR